MNGTDHVSGAESRKLERRVTYLENLVVRAPVFLGVTSLILGLMTPILHEDEDQKSYFLVAMVFQAFSEPPNTSGSVQGENIILGIGVLGLIICVLATAVFLVRVWGRDVGPRWRRIGGVAVTLMTIGTAVIGLPSFLNDVQGSSVGVGMYLLVFGALSAILVTIVLRGLWSSD